MTIHFPEATAQRNFNVLGQHPDLSQTAMICDTIYMRLNGTLSKRILYCMLEQEGVSDPRRETRMDAGVSGPRRETRMSIHSGLPSWIADFLLFKHAVQLTF